MINRRVPSALSGWVSPHRYPRPPPSTNNTTTTTHQARCNWHCFVQTKNLLIPSRCGLPSSSSRELTWMCGSPEAFCGCGCVCVPDVTPQTDDDPCPGTVNCDHLARHRGRQNISFLLIILRGSFSFKATVQGKYCRGPFAPLPSSRDSRGQPGCGETW